MRFKNNEYIKFINFSFSRIKKATRYRAHQVRHLFCWGKNADLQLLQWNKICKRILYTKKSTFPILNLKGISVQRKSNSTSTFRLMRVKNWPLTSPKGEIKTDCEISYLENVSVLDQTGYIFPSFSQFYSKLEEKYCKKRIRLTFWNTLRPSVYIAPRYFERNF